VRSRLWISFLAFALIILAILGSFQVAFITPYYRNSKVDAVNALEQTVERLIINNRNITQSDLKTVSDNVVNNNVCLVVYNLNRKELYSADSLGDECIINKELNFNGENIVISRDYLKMTDYFDHDSLTYTYTSPISSNDMLLVGKIYRDLYENYYVFVNASMEPIGSYMSFIGNLYTFATILIIIISIVLTYYLADRFSKPIVEMKNSATKLAESKFDEAVFDGGGFSELDVLADTLNDASSKLSKVDELRKDLFANVSHDLKTPLTSIKAYAEMIKDISGDDPEKRDKHLDVILQEADYLEKLIYDLQEISKAQAGYGDLKLENVDLTQLCEEVISSFDALALSRKITFVPKLNPAIIYADKFRIQEVIKNFISNAIKFSEDGSKIWINVTDSEEKVSFEVIDEGSGIAKEELPYIWDRYYKIDKNYSRSVKQTGLGLAICKAILDAHNARYGVSSTPGKGSRFYFEFDKNYEEGLSQGD
jgi:two-component system sensor histidine kinase ArlS